MKKVAVVFLSVATKYFATRVFIFYGYIKVLGEIFIKKTRFQKKRIFLIKQAFICYKKEKIFKCLLKKASQKVYFLKVIYVSKLHSLAK